MITKGASSIRGVHSVNSRPGPLDEPSALRRLYLLSCEKSGLIKRKYLFGQWLRQAQKRLGEIHLAMSKVKATAELDKIDQLKEKKSNPGRGGISIKY